MNTMKITDYNYGSGARSVLINLNRIAFVEADGRLRLLRAGSAEKAVLHEIFFTGDLSVSVDEADYRRIAAAMGLK